MGRNLNFLQILFFFLLSSCTASYSPCDSWNLLPEYDAIIVGSGIGGSVIARRLAEQNPSWNILVVERGIPWDQCLTCSDPGSALKAYFSPATGPMVNSAPQEGFDSKTIPIKDTMVQGGSSSINVMYHVRCDSETYFNTHWPASWNWTSIKPYIKRYENYTFSNDLYNSTFNYAENYRSNSGPVKITQVDLAYGDGIVKLGLEKIKSIYPNIPVYENNSLNNDGINGIGSAPQEFFASPGLRSSAYIAYIKSYTGKNMKTITQVRANRVLFNGTTATGVELQFVSSGKGYMDTCTVRASRAVIISSGALGSPKLLKLSGVGPRAELEALGIPVVVANDQVGAHLNDHATALVYCIPTTNYVPYYYGYPNAFHSSYWNADDVPGAHPNFYMSMNSEVLLGVNAVVIQTSAMNTNSFGSVTLASSNPDDAPVVDPGYLANATDKAIFAKAYAKSFTFAKDIGCNELPDYCALGGCDTDIDRLNKYTAAGQHIPGYHFAGTCGVQRVVDENTFAVIGTQKLFVVDASALPYSPPGNPSSIIYMVSERVSDRINQVLRQPGGSNAGEVTYPPLSYVQGNQPLLKIKILRPVVYSFSVVAVTTGGTPRTSGGDTVTVSVSSLLVPVTSAVTVTDLHTGTYRVDITIEASLVGVVSMNVLLNNQAISGGTFTVTVVSLA